MATKTGDLGMIKKKTQIKKQIVAVPDACCDNPYFINNAQLTKLEPCTDENGTVIKKCWKIVMKIRSKERPACEKNLTGQIKGKRPNR